MTVTAPLPATRLPATRLPATRPSAIERLELPAANLTRHMVLRACEALRRRVARWTTGHAGASAGFVEVDLDELPDLTSGTVVVRATVVASTDRCQRVRYDVSLRPSPEIVVDGLSLELPVGCATGLTVALPPGV